MSSIGQGRTDDASEAPSGLPVPEGRGVLDIPPKVISRIAGHSACLHAECTEDPDIDIVESSPGHLDLKASLTIAYPVEPLGPLLNRVRSGVAGDLAYQTGRSVDRLDLRVDRFVEPPPPPRVI